MGLFIYIQKKTLERFLAIQAMGLIGSKDVMGTLVLALRDTDERVRDAAAYSLNQIF